MFGIKPIYQWGWTNEGVFYRKKDWIIRKPTKHETLFRLNKVKSKPGYNEIGEGPHYSLKKAMKAGNWNIRHKL